MPMCGGGGDSWAQIKKDLKIRWTKETEKWTQSYIICTRVQVHIFRKYELLFASTRWE
jgi:hypothetical protein